MHNNPDENVFHEGPGDRESGNLAEELAASRELLAQTVRQLAQARLELSLDRDRQEGYAKAVRRSMDRLVELIEPLLGNLSAFRISKTYRVGALAGAMSRLPLAGRLALLGRAIKHFGFRRHGPFEIPENEIILTLQQLASQARDEINAVRGLRITRPEFSTLPDLPAAPASIGAAAAAPHPAPAGAEGAILACPPLISVLLPVFNQAGMLGGAVESVRAQTYANWEIVILDDGSTDGLDEALRRLRDDPRIRIYREPNQTRPNALTHLHRLAHGEFITWMPAGDRMAPAMLERLARAMAEDPETVLVYADTALTGEDGAPLEGGGYRDHNRDAASPALVRLPMNAEALGEEPDNYIGACFLYRAEAARAAGPHAADLESLEDYDFFLRLRRAGRCRHVGNAEPLYFMRVRRRTAGEEAEAQRCDADGPRGQMLIDHDRERGRWFDQRWNVLLSTGLAEEERERLRGLLERMPINVLDAPPASGRDGKGEPLKVLRLLAPGEGAAEDGAAIAAGPDEYTLLRIEGGQAREIGRVPRGQDISGLALKSRRQGNPAVDEEFVKAEGRPILGTHLSFADVDAARTIGLLNAHPGLFFALFDDERRADPAKGRAIAAACPNCVYLGPRPYGHPYGAYADFAAVICPPLAGERAGRAVRQAQQLALASGRWLLYPAGAPLGETPAFAMPYAPGDAFPEAWRCERPSLHPHSLDLYLRHGSEAGALERALRLMGTAFQETFIPRPDFGQRIPRTEDPRPWRPAADARLPEGWIGLWIDSLDRGGLEEILALLAAGLRGRGVQVRILCSERGGLVADRLMGQGFPCEIFGRDAARFEDSLRHDPPLLLSTHATRQMLDVPARLGIPVVETIHNMVIHYDEAMWAEERRRAASTARLIAVSRLVRDDYLRGHGALDGGKITVIHNAADHRRTLGIERGWARQMLGVEDRTCVYLNLASFEGRKNQLGLLTAFERLHAERPDTMLVMMGNVANQDYYGRLMKQLAASPARAAVRRMDFQSDMARILAAADVFVLPSYFEGWSVSATEARYAGLPIIHTLCGSGPELCGEGGGYLIDNPGGDPLGMHPAGFHRDCQDPDPPNTGVLAGAMRCALNDLERWRASRARLRTEAVAQFSPVRMVDEYLAVFRDVGASRAGQAT